MDRLRQTLDRLIAELSQSQQEFIRLRLDNLVSFYPFNEYEYIISSLLGLGKLTLDDYYEIRDEYIARNMYLYIFEISSPRGFGEQWAQGHLKELVPDLIKPSRKLDANYAGQYDFYLPHEGSGIMIEVKASHVR